MNSRRQALWLAIAAVGLISLTGCGCRPVAESDVSLPTTAPSIDQERQQALEDVDRRIEQPTAPLQGTVESDPNTLSPEALQQQARAYRADLLAGGGQPEQALQELQDALKQFPESTLLRAKIIGVQRRLGREEEALAGYRELADRDPQHAAEHWDSASQILVQQGRFEEALTELNKSIAREPELSLDVTLFDPIDRYRARAAILERLGRTAEAAADRQRADQWERSIWPMR